MKFLLLAFALPGLFWDAGPDGAPALREAGVSHVLVPAAQADSWKSVAGITAEAGDLAGAEKLQPPTVNYRIDRASATRAPWLDSNGWIFLRQPRSRFYYDAKGPQAALAAAEAFCYGADAVVHTDAAGVKPFAEMLNFLRTVDAGEMPQVADFGFVDDGSDAAGEVMNLLIRYNLQFKLVTAPDPHLKLNVKLGTPEYPLEDAADPGKLAHAVRFNLTDEKRSLRIYGSAVVIARLTGSGNRARLHLLNYAGAERQVDGIRVRILGRFPKHRLAAAGSPGEQLLDYQVDSQATEFTLPELKTYAVVDLSR